MGCSSSLQQNNKTPLIIDGENIISIIFNIDGGRIKMPSITLPFFRLGNIFLLGILQNSLNQEYNDISKLKFSCDNKDITQYFLNNYEACNLNSNNIEIICEKIKL